MTQSGDKLTGALNKVGKVGAVAFAAVGTAAAGMAVKAIKDFAEFETKMNEVFTMLPNITQQGMDNMTAQVKKFSKDFGVLPEKVVPALYQALSAGVPEDNVFKFMETAQKAALGGVTSLETAVDGISSVINSYGADVISASQASDLMFTTVRLGKTNFEQLSQSLFNVLPSAAAAGVKFQDVSAALAAVTAQGVPTSVASTKIRSAIDEMSKAGTKTSDIFKKISGKTFKDFISRGGNLQQALSMMEKHAKSSGVGINDLFSSVEAGSAALSLTGKGTSKFTDAMKQMQNSAGATDAAYARMDKGLKRTWDRIKANAAVSLLDLGDTLAPGIEKIANVILYIIPYLQKGLEKSFTIIGPILEGAFELFKWFFKGIRYLFKGESLFDSFLGLMDTVNDILFSVFDRDTAMKLSDMMAQGFEKLDDIYTIVQNVFGNAKNVIKDFTSNSEVIDFINLILDSFAGFSKVSFKQIELLSNAFIELSQSLLDVYASTEFQQFISTVKNLIVDVVNLLMNKVLPVVSDISSFIIDKVVDMGKFIYAVVKENIIPFATEIIAAFQEHIMPVIEDVINYISTTILPIFKDAITFITDTILPILKDTFDEVFPHLASIVENAFVIIQGVWENILKPVVDDIVGAFLFAWPFIKGLIEANVTNIKNIISGLIQTFDGIIEFVAGVFTGDWSRAWDGVKNIFGGVFSTLAGLVKRPLNTVIGLVNGAIEHINGISIDIPDWVPDILGGGKHFGISIPKIPMLAKGTESWRGGEAIVGDAGAELVLGPQYGDLPRGSKVLPHDKTLALLESMQSNLNSSSMDMNINPNVDSISNPTLMPSKADNPTEIIKETGNNSNHSPQDNRSYVIHLPGNIIQAKDKEDFIDKVKNAIETILDEDIATGGELSFDF